jgi:transcriptional regulator with XRE-family HTH domain
MKAAQEARYPRPLRLRRERQRRGWSQFYAGTLADIEPSTLAQIERGHRFAYPGWRKRLAAAFDLPEEVLFAPAEEDENDDDR